jgi:hypothetical protein
MRMVLQEHLISLLVGMENDLGQVEMFCEIYRDNKRICKEKFQELTDDFVKVIQANGRKSKFLEFFIILQKAEDEFIPQNTKEMLLKTGAPDAENARTVKYLPQVEEYVGDFLKENFWSYLVFHITGGKDFLLSSHQLLSTWQLNPAIRLYSTIEPYMWAAIYLLALLGVMVSRHRFALFLAALCAVVILTAGTFSSNTRYLLPILPAIFLLAGLGIERLHMVLSAAIFSLLRSIRCL